MSVLYIEEKSEYNRILLDTYDRPRFADERHGSHMIHGSHHEGALDYMCNHHKTDEGPPTPVANVKLVDVGCPFPYYKTATNSETSFVASWAQPPDDTRVDLRKLWNHITGASDESVKWDRGGTFRADLGLTYPICKSCNALMTQLSYMRYIVGFASNADRNKHGSVIKDSFKGISAYKAVKNRAKKALSKAYGEWSVKPNSLRDKTMLPSRTTGEDPEAPHIAYYLHLCQPFQAIAATDPFNTSAWLAGSNSVEAGRIMFFQEAWVLLVIVCLATQIEQGRLHGDHKLAHGMHQHYGVLDVYVSYFIWNLCRYDYARQLERGGLDFVQWHQKYFWFATELPGIGSRNFAAVGLACYTNVRVPARQLLAHVCDRLMDLYYGPLRPLIQLVTGTFPDPMTDACVFAKHYFIPLGALQTLQRACTSGVREDDFESALETVGIRAMLARVMRLCHPELLPMLKSFKRSWQQLETERVRRKTPGLTVYSAGVVVRLCELLTPPAQLPKDKTVLAAVLRGRRCSPWTSVLALREMGAFTNGDGGV